MLIGIIRGEISFGQLHYLFKKVYELHKLKKNYLISNANQKLKSAPVNPLDLQAHSSTLYIQTTDNQNINLF